MPPLPPEYERVKAPASDFMAAGDAHHSLWLAADHLLYVIREGYTESYKRFYFRDVRAIVLHRTIRHVVVSSIFGFLFGVFASFLYVSTHRDWDEGASIAFAIFATLFLIPLVINLARGPSCVCRLFTAVQELTLYPLSRVRTATRIVALLRERIETTQGALPRTELDTRMAVPATGSERAPVPVPPVPQGNLRVRNCTGKAHLLLFLLLLVDFASRLAGFVSDAAVAHAVIRWSLLGLTAFASIASVVSQERSTMWPEIRRLAWSALAYLGATVTVASVFTVSMPIRYGSEYLENPQHFMQPTATTEAFAWGVVAVIASGTIGGLGLIRILAYRRLNTTRMTPPPLPPLPTPPPISSDALPPLIPPDAVPPEAPPPSSEASP